MEVPEADIKQLLESVQRLTQDVSSLRDENRALKEAVEKGGGSRRVLKAITERQVRIRRVDGKVVVGFRNKSGNEQKPLFVYEMTDPNDKNNKILMVDLILEGMTKPEEALPTRYNEFLAESEQVECLVVKAEETPWAIEQGMTKQKMVDEYSTVELDFDIPLEVIGVEKTYTVRLPEDGREVTLHEQYVNI